MMVIAFEKGVFPMPKQHPSGMDDWEEDYIDSSQILPEELRTLLPSLKRKKD